MVLLGSLLLCIAGCSPLPELDREESAVDTAAQEHAQKERPSIILVLADDLGWADIQSQGSPWPTPAIEALAADGIRFTRGAANAPNCAPSRACLMTGTDVAAHGIHTVHPSARGKESARRLVPPPTRRRLDDGAVTIAEVLKDAGYTSAHFGKWHLGNDPTAQGFDVAVAGNQRGSIRRHLAPWNLPGLEEGPDGQPLADALTDMAVTFIEDHASTPYLLVVSHYAVHTPVQAPPEEIAAWAKQLPDESRRRHRYAAMVDSVDRSVARIRQALEESGTADRTLLIFTSDNGGHEGFTDNGELRGGKGKLFEGGIRVPLVFAGYGVASGGRVNDTPVQLTDLAPTIFDLCRVTPPAEIPWVGESLTPVLSGAPTLPERDLIWHFPAYLEGPRRAGGWRTTPAAAICRGNYKLIEFFEDGSRLLFDLAADPGETNDLSALYPQVTSDLAGRLERWREEREPPMPIAKE